MLGNFFKNILFIVIFVSFCLSVLSSCSEDGEKRNSKEIVVTISIKDEIFVNGEQVSIDSLVHELQEMGVSAGTFIKIAPDPEAGPGTIDKVQRTIRLFKSSSPQNN